MKVALMAPRLMQKGTSPPSNLSEFVATMLLRQGSDDVVSHAGVFGQRIKKVGPLRETIWRLGSE